MDRIYLRDIPGVCIKGQIAGTTDQVDVVVHSWDDFLASHRRFGRLRANETLDSFSLPVAEAARRHVSALRGREAKAADAA
jgi:hypothetical protein